MALYKRGGCRLMEERVGHESGRDNVQAAKDTKRKCHQTSD
jgi:hypothetical protein